MNLKEQLIKQTILMTWEDSDIADLLGIRERDFNYLMDEDPTMVEQKLDLVVQNEGEDLVARGLVEI